MAALAYVSAWTLAVVFVWAAAAKLARPAVTRAGFAGLGLPAAQMLVWAIPAAELGVAVALAASPPFGGALALVLLAAFTAFVVRALRRGAATGCSCFGSASRRPISPTDVIRNALLGGLALIALKPAWPAVAVAAAAGAAWAASLARRRGRTSNVPG